MKLTYLQIYEGHSGGIETVAFSPDSSYILTGSHDGTFRYWDTFSGKLIRKFHNHGRSKAPVKDIFFCNNGTQALVTNWGYARTKHVRDGALIIDLLTGDEVMRLSTKGVVLSSALSPSNRYALTSSASQIILWDISTGAEIKSLSPYHNANVAFHPDERTFYVGAMKHIQSYAITASGTSDKIYEDFDVSHLGGMVVSSGGKYLVASGFGIKIWNCETGQLLYHLMQQTHVRDIAISPDEKILVSVGDDIHIRVWDIFNGKELVAINGHQSDIISVVFSTDGKMLLTGGFDKNACLWSIE